MDRPSSVPVGLQLPTLPRPSSPFARTQNVKEETAKHMADLKKENFSLKLKIYYLETTLSKVSGVEQFDVLNENVQLKVEKENLTKELETNKELLIKASSVVDSLSNKQGGYSEGEARLGEENEELQRLVSKLENELLTARQEFEQQSLELEHVHTDCMLLEDQLRQKEQAYNEQQYEAPDVMGAEEVETLQAKLDAQEHLYLTATQELKQELDEVRDVMIKTHEENIGNRLVLAEKDQQIRELKTALAAAEKTDSESSEHGESRASLLEMCSTYTATNARLEEELNSMENTNTELNNVINNLSNEREKLLDELADTGDLQQQVKDYETQIDQLRQELHELRFADTPDYQAENEALVNELKLAQEEVEELKHNLTQLRLNNDITAQEAAILRGSFEETELKKLQEESLCKTLKQNVERLSKENAECSQENTTLQQENEMLRDKVQELNNDICELKEDIRNLKKDKTSSNTSKHNELSEEILSLKQSLSDAHEELRYSKEDMKSLESDYERTSEELELVEEELRESENKRVAVTDELDEIKEEFLKQKMQLNDEKVKLKQHKADAEIKMVEHQSKVAELLNDKSELENDLVNYQTQVSELLKNKDQLEYNVKNLTKEKGKLGFEVKKLEADLKNKKEKSRRDAAEDTGDELYAQKSYIEDRIKELQDTKQSLEDSVLSLKDQLSNTPVPYYHPEQDIEESRLKDTMIGELKSERDHHRTERKDLEKELRRIHEMIHDLIRQLHRYNNTPTPAPSNLHLKSTCDDFLVDSLKDAIEMVINNMVGRDRQISNTSSVQTTSGVVSGVDVTFSSDKDTSLGADRANKIPVGGRQEDLAALQRENSLLHTDLLESRDLIAALRKEMKDLLEKLNSTDLGDKHVKNMLTQINNLISTSLLQSPYKSNSSIHHDSNLSNGHDYSNGHDVSNGHEGDVDHTVADSEHRLAQQRLKAKEQRLLETESKLKHAVQELSSTECKLTATQSKLAVADHKIQNLENQLHKQYRANAPTNHHNVPLLNQKVESLEVQLQNTEELLKEKMKLIRDKNEVIDSLLDEKRSKSRAESEEKSRSYYDITNGTCMSPNRSYHSSTRIGVSSPPSPIRGVTAHDLTPTTIQVSDYILLCANNWLDELPELMRALRDAVHNSLVDCKSVQTRVTERKAVWAMAEVSRLSTRLDAVYRLLQHVENLSIQQPPSRLVHSLQQQVTDKDHELTQQNEKLLKRSRDIQKLRSKLEDQDKVRLKQKLLKTNMVGLNPSILSKVIDTETVLREAHKSLERRMVSKENQKHNYS